jgi:hypothetical protein
MYFGTKSYLKSTRNHTAKHAFCFGQMGGPPAALGKIGLGLGLALKFKKLK